MVEGRRQASGKHFDGGNSNTICGMTLLLSGESLVRRSAFVKDKLLNKILIEIMKEKIEFKLTIINHNIINLHNQK